MPIRIPNFSPSSSGQIPQGVSISDAVKPALALSNVAEGIGKAGDRLYEHDMKIMEVENAADLIDFEVHAKTVYANRVASYKDDHDYESFKDSMRKDLDGLEKFLSEKSYAQTTVAKARMFLKDFRGNAMIKAASAAQSKSAERRDQMVRNGIAQAERVFDPNQPHVARSIRDDVLAKSGLTPEIQEAIVKQTEYAFQRKEQIADINEDPAAFLAKEKPAGSNWDEWRKYQSHARGVLSQLVNEQGKQALDAIASRAGVTDGDIRGIMSDARPSEVARVIAYRDRMNDEAARREIESDSYQEALIGETAGLLIDYDPNGKHEDDTLLVIQSKLREMKPGIHRERLEARLNDTMARAQAGWKEEASKIKDVRDWTVRQFDEDFSARRKKVKVGDVPKVTRTVRDHVKDGFLQDGDKLRAIGFSDDQIEKIRKAEEDTDSSILGSLLPDNEVTLNAQADMFKDLWEKRTGEVTADADALEMAHALAKGRGGLDKVFSEVDDPVALAKAETIQRAALTEERQKYARALNQVEEAFAADPKMTMERAAQLVEDAGYDVEAGDTGLNFEIPALDREETQVPALEEVGEFKVFTGSRDQLDGFTSAEGSRKIALDFNDAKNKSARGIEIVLPRSHSPEERRLAGEWARQTQAFFKAKGVVVPIRQNGTGVKIGGGKAGVIHTEPFFAANRAARRAIMSDPEGYARVLGGTLGKIPGMTFIAPHTRNGAQDSNPGQGAQSGRFSERSFAMEVILPALMKLKK